MTARNDRGAGDIARIVASADDLEEAVRALERSPGIGRSALEALRSRRPDPERPAPLSTAVLVRLAAPSGPDGLAASVPFLADASPIVQAEVADAIDDLEVDELSPALLRLAERSPVGGFWDAVVDLVASREEPGVARLLIGLLERLRSPEAQAAILEVLPFAAGKKDAAAAKKAISAFLGDRRPVPGAESDEGPVTFAMFATEALDALTGAR